MFYTEDEARKKWCSESRTGAYADFAGQGMVTTNRDPRDDVQDSCCCIASDCMKWTWAVVDRNGILQAFPTQASALREGLAADVGGFCGLNVGAPVRR